MTGEQRGSAFLTGVLGGDVLQGRADHFHVDVVAGRARLALEQCFAISGHGRLEGQGGTGTALGNATMLALTPDAFLRHAIENGRAETPMKPFKGVLSAQEIDGVTAFLRADGTVAYADLMAVMNLLRAAGYLKIALVGLEDTGQQAGTAPVAASPGTP